MKAPAGTEASIEPSSSLEVSEPRQAKSAHARECPKCLVYKTRLANNSEELKKKDEYIERLKEDLNKLRAQLSTSKKVFSINRALSIYFKGCSRQI